MNVAMQHSLDARTGIRLAALDYRRAVANAMLRARGRTGLSAKAFAVKMGEAWGEAPPHEGSIGEWERGEAEPKAKALLAAALISGVTVERLVYEGQPDLLYDRLAELAAGLAAAHEEIAALKAQKPQHSPR